MKKHYLVRMQVELYGATVENGRPFFNKDLGQYYSKREFVVINPHEHNDEHHIRKFKNKAIRDFPNLSRFIAKTIRKELKKEAINEMQKVRT